MSEQTPRRASTLRITLKRSLIGRPKDQGETVRSLRLRKIHQTVEHEDTPSVRGMIYKVRHLVDVEEISA
ncbi:MAG: 50S ribosomal protein L30 [Thermomicrobiales bacterium]